MEILCVSNGHGEDQVAARICVALESHGVSAMALPLVGVGHAYRKPQIPVLEEAIQAMPSGGFVRMDGRNLWRDLREGLVRLTWKQIQVIWRWSRTAKAEKRLVLAVGDVVPLLFAWLPTLAGGCDFAFMATAKSEYYWRDRHGRLPRIPQPWGGSFFHPLELSLVGSRHCRCFLVRDRLTADHLGEMGLPALYLGNPMMDGLEPRGLDFGIREHEWAIALLPGSRAPEAYDNWVNLLTCAEIAQAHLPATVHFLAAMAPTLDPKILTQILQQRGWRAVSEDSPGIFMHQKGRLHLVTQGFSDCLHQSHLGLATAGTATEQLVGLGKPVIAIAGSGPQFTAQFAQDQSRLLGCSLTLIHKPAQIAQVIERIREDPDYVQLAMSNGRERMGEPGAAERIAKHLVQMLQG